MCFADRKISSETAIRFRYCSCGTVDNIAANLPRYRTLIPLPCKASTNILPSIAAAVWSKHSRIYDKNIEINIFFNEIELIYQMWKYSIKIF